MVPQSMRVRQLPHEGDLVTDINVMDYFFRYFCICFILPPVQLGMLREKGRVQLRKPPYEK